MRDRDVLAELEARGLIHDVTDREELRKLLAEEKISFYAGYDPTARSLHAGNLVPLRAMRALSDAGHKMIAVVGGATGMIGDPSGRSSERNLQDEETLAANLAGITAQIRRFVSADARVVNNRDWSNISFLEFLRDVGKYITVNYMLAKESVKNRLEGESGLSYTEFSYMLLQAMDFAHLATAYDCRLQLGGSDQWGNITCGIELHRKRGGEKRIYGLVTPLLLNANGEKFGKSSGGLRVWLDPAETTPYQFYQFWINATDADVEKYLKMFSFIPLPEIAAIMDEHRRDPGKRVAQKRLAEDVTRWVHGEGETARAIEASKAMFSGKPDVATLGDDVPTVTVAAGTTVIDALVAAKLTRSKGEARRLIEQGGVTMNGDRVTDVAAVVQPGSEGAAILRAGKKNYCIAKVG